MKEAVFEVMFSNAARRGHEMGSFAEKEGDPDAWESKCQKCQRVMRARKGKDDKWDAVFLMGSPHITRC